MGTTSAPSAAPSCVPGRLPFDPSTEPTWGMAAPSTGRVSPMAAARAAVPMAAVDGASILDGFLRAEGLLREAAAGSDTRLAALEASAGRWYRLGHTPRRLAADMASAERHARGWRAFAAEVRGLGVAVAAARALAGRAVAESDALRLYLEAEGLGALRGGRLVVDGARLGRDLEVARRGLQRLGYRCDRALAVGAVGDWAAPRLARLEGAARLLQVTLSAVRVHPTVDAAPLCDQLAELAVQAASAALDLQAEEPRGSGPCGDATHFPYRERITSLGRRLGATLGPAVTQGGGLAPDPRAAVDAFSGALGALRQALVTLPQRLDDYANGFENLGACADRAALGPHAAGTSPHTAAALAHLARIQATHVVLAGQLGLVAARQDAVAEARERLLGFSSPPRGSAPRAPLPQPAAAVDLFYFSVTRGFAHTVADLDQRQAELAAVAEAFADLLERTR
ncbi:MAG: hypothetical protein ABIO70_00565 [Pseudomonadota bacterium]